MKNYPMTADCALPLKTYHNYLKLLYETVGSKDLNEQKWLAKEYGFGSHSGIGEIVYAMSTSRSLFCTDHVVLVRLMSPSGTLQGSPAHTKIQHKTMGCTTGTCAPALSYWSSLWLPSIATFGTSSYLGVLSTILSMLMALKIQTRQLAPGLNVPLVVLVLALWVSRLAISPTSSRQLQCCPPKLSLWLLAIWAA
ncbi:LOW QUALITY PROTEIN: hypothetical protein ACHAWF_003425 [Thalassiosira exigua]